MLVLVLVLVLVITPYARSASRVVARRPAFERLLWRLADYGPSSTVRGSWGKPTRDAVRNTERWKGRRTPTQDPSANLTSKLLLLLLLDGAAACCSLLFTKNNPGANFQAPSQTRMSHSAC